MLRRKQGGLGAIAFLALFFISGYLVCLRSILTFQLLQSLEKKASKTHLGTKTIFVKKLF